MTMDAQQFKASSAPAGRPVLVIKPIRQPHGKISYDLVTSEGGRPIILDILERVGDSKVAIVSVAGGFRTGKSFLLGFLLRHLQAQQRQQQHEQQQQQQAPSSPLAAFHSRQQSFSRSDLQKALSTGTLAQPAAAAPAADAFHWRSAAGRTTAGIWMWPEPLMLNLSGDAAGRARGASVGSSGSGGFGSSGGFTTSGGLGSFSSSGSGAAEAQAAAATPVPPVAVLLMDTHGLSFRSTRDDDNAIFTLSALLSSYQIYNVPRQIEEHDLQHLALFSEYARMCVTCEPPPPRRAAAGGYLSDSDSDSSEDFGCDDDDDNAFACDGAPPFQRLEFLVRDWAHFARGVGAADMERAMADYGMATLSGEGFGGVQDADLQATRQHLRCCFEDIGCFGVPYPGEHVSDPHFDGAVALIDPRFRELLERYTRHVFCTLEPKKVHGAAVTGRELGAHLAHWVRQLCDDFLPKPARPAAPPVQVIVRASSYQQRASADADAQLALAVEHALTRYQEVMQALLQHSRSRPPLMAAPGSPERRMGDVGGALSPARRLHAAARACALAVYDRDVGECCGAPPCAAPPREALAAARQRLERGLQALLARALLQEDEGRRMSDRGGRTDGRTSSERTKACSAERAAPFSSPERRAA